jgi:hypothetical protein
MESNHFLILLEDAVSEANLQFKLPEEQEEFYAAMNGGEAFSALSGIQERLRIWRKHGHEFKTADEALDGMWQELHDQTEDLHF